MGNTELNDGEKVVLMHLVANDLKRVIQEFPSAFAKCSNNNEDAQFAVMKNYVTKYEALKQIYDKLNAN